MDMKKENEIFAEEDDAEDTYGLCSVTWLAYLTVYEKEGFKSHIIRQIKIIKNGK